MTFIICIMVGKDKTWVEGTIGAKGFLEQCEVPRDRYAAMEVCLAVTFLCCLSWKELWDTWEGMHAFIFCMPYMLYFQGIIVWTLRADSGLKQFSSGCLINWQCPIWGPADHVGFPSWWTCFPEIGGSKVPMWQPLIWFDLITNLWSLTTSKTCTY